MNLLVYNIFERLLLKSVYIVFQYFLSYFIILLFIIIVIYCYFYLNVIFINLDLINFLNSLLLSVIFSSVLMNFLRER